ncbi:MAG TPA: DUF302 domain-containing protein [Bacteroidales bacterium]|nr:DUF302 domain-containing protein [Bacteroidales bacterium]
MKYYYEKSLHGEFGFAVDKVKESLANEGFGVLTEIDVRKTFKNKLDVDFRNYVILGACNPLNAYKALTAEDKIGILLPCNVVVQEIKDRVIEVAAVDPAVVMKVVGNAELESVAGEVREKLIRVIDSL